MDFTTALTAYGAGDDGAAADANASVVVPLLGSSAYGGGDGGAAGWSAASLAFETAVEGMLAWLTTTTASSDAFCASPWNCRFFFFFFPFFCASPWNCRRVVCVLFVVFSPRLPGGRRRDSSGQPA